MHYIRAVYRLSFKGPDGCAEFILFCHDGSKMKQAYSHVFKQWHVSHYRARGNFSIQLMMKYSKIDLTSDVLASSHNIYCLQNRVKHILKLSSSSVYCSTRTAQRGSPGDTTARRSELNSNLCCSILGAAPTVCSGGGEWQLGLMIIALTIAMIILLLFLLTAESPRFCSLLPLLV